MQTSYEELKYDLFFLPFTFSTMTVAKKNISTQWKSLLFTQLQKLSEVYPIYETTLDSQVDAAATSRTFFSFSVECVGQSKNINFFI